VDALRIDFEGLEWQAFAPGGRHKLAERAGKRIRLAEFSDAFVEGDWCERGHVGYVLGGTLEIVFEGRTERFGSGEGFVIRGNGAEKHKARSLGPVARLLLVEDI
jgi:hypothetical protein